MAPWKFVDYDFDYDYDFSWRTLCKNFISQECSIRDALVLFQGGAMVSLQKRLICMCSSPSPGRIVKTNQILPLHSLRDEYLLWPTFILNYFDMPPYRNLNVHISEFKPQLQLKLVALAYKFAVELFYIFISLEWRVREFLARYIMCL